jgi:hypothetical protein
MSSDRRVVPVLDGVEGADRIGLERCEQPRQVVLGGAALRDRLEGDLCAGHDAVARWSWR